LAAGPSGGRDVIARYGRVLLAAVAGGVLFLIAHKALLAMTGVTPSSHYYSASIDWHFWERWTFIRNEIDFLLLGADNVIPGKAVVIAFLAAMVWLLQASGRRHGASSRLRALALEVMLVAALVVAPFSMLFLHAGQLAPRSTVGLAVVWLALYASGRRESCASP
jgi:hypothetical protein